MGGSSILDQELIGRAKGLLHQFLEGRRLSHSLRVAGIAAQLAGVHALDREKSYLAGLLHDVARDLPPAVLLQNAKASGILKNEIGWVHPVLWHGPVGAELVRDKLGIHDEELLSAIRWHTTGTPGMTGVVRLIYVADAIEPGRDYPRVKLIREVARRDLVEAAHLVARSTLEYLLSGDMPIHPLTVEVYNERFVGDEKYRMP